MTQPPIHLQAPFHFECEDLSEITGLKLWNKPKTKKKMMMDCEDSGIFHKYQWVNNRVNTIILFNYKD